jgi:AraC family transcriptional regulator
MLDAVTPETLTTWVPGEILLASDALGWSDVALRSYRYTGLDIEAPPLRDFLVVAFLRGSTTIDRRVGGPWQQEQLVPGDVSVMTCGEASQWRWDASIDVIHLYLTRKLLGKVCADALDKEVADIELHDVLKAGDVVLNRGLAAMAEEVRTENLGGKLFVDALTTQICVHLVRKYADVSVRETTVTTALSRVQSQQIEGYIEANLDRQLSLDELAAVARTSTSCFLRQFKARYGVPPHAYVIQKRLACARQLLTKSTLPIKEIASRCGFSDQSHMTRVFQRLLQTTPCSYRQTSKN